MHGCLGRCASERINGTDPLHQEDRTEFPSIHCLRHRTRLLLFATSLPFMLRPASTSTRRPAHTEPYATARLKMENDAYVIYAVRGLHLATARITLLGHEAAAGMFALKNVK